MAYCTPEDVSVVTGERYDEDQERYIEFWLDIIALTIDDLIEDYGKNPSDVPEDRKMMVSQLMGKNAAIAFQIDPDVVSSTLTSGDTSESESRVASGSSYKRITYIEPIYLKILGLKSSKIVSIRTRTSWS